MVELVEDLAFPRLLEEDDEELDPPTDSSIIRDTLRVYGSLYFFLILLFCYLRKKYPRTYNVRSWIPDLKCELAEEHFGYFDWFWKVWYINDDDFREQTGMDALGFTRIFRFGLRIALVGMFNSLWLMPLYATVPKTPDTEHVTDHLAMTTVSHVPPGSTRFIGTVIAAYITFGYTMYMLLKEFEWFTENRHKFLMEKQPRNYTIYVSHIPPEYRSSAKLCDYFRSCFSHDSVSEAHIGLKIPLLEKKVAGREALCNQLEHAINIEEVKGITPKRGSIIPGGKSENLIDALSEELKEANKDIRDSIIEIENMHDPLSFKNDLEAEGGSVYAKNAYGSNMSATSSVTGFDENGKPSRSFQKHVDEGSEPGDHDDDEFAKSETDQKFAGKMFAGMKGAAAEGMKLMSGVEDGEVRESGFVAFTKLSTTQAALQMVHHHVPFVMEVAEAPNPSDIFWPNIGKTHQALQTGKLASLTCTILLCLFWTIPVAFVVSLTSIEGLKESLPFLEGWIEEAPWLAPALAQISPLMLIVMKSLLPIILGEFSKLEGPISSSVLEASLFVKLAYFEIIQTFFVSTLSGSLTKQVSNIVQNPTELVNLLATSLPGQSTYFMQLLLVQTFLGAALELLRVSPIAIAYIRSKVGPNLTEKERNTTWFGLRPIADPGEFQYADVTSNAMLYWMVLFVYNVLAPATSWFLAFCFLILISGYRHQLIYNYPTTPDSGGQLWLSFINIALPCILIAQFTLIGYLALKQATIAGPLMFPLLIITILFNFYVRQRHFSLPNRLSSKRCMQMDLQRKGEGMDMSFVKKQYLQTALQSKEDVFPENFSVAREMEQQQIRFMTPPSSECEIIPEDIPFGEEPPVSPSVSSFAMFSSYSAKKDTKS